MSKSRQRPKSPPRAGKNPARASSYPIMKLPTARQALQRSRGRPSRRGAALLLSLLVLFVLVAIVFQINVTVGTDARMARNDVGLTSMDLAVESALMRVLDELKQDGEAAASGGGGPMGGGAGAAGAGGGDPAGAAGGGGEGGEGGGGTPASDSHEDTWGKPQQTSFEEMDVRLRILIQDEDAKYNILSMMQEDEDLAEEAFERVVRIIDLCREDTDYDIDRSEAERMATVMRDHMQRRSDSAVPMTEMLTYDEERRDVGLPMTLREFEALEPFDTSHFRDFRDEDGMIVHSLGSYLTVWSALATSSEVNGQGQGAGGGQDSNEAPEEGDENDGTQGQGDLQNNPDGTTTASGAAGGGQGQGGDLSQGPQTLTGGYFGISVNINTAPPAVLKGLFDSRDVNPRFWDDVIRYRNEEQEEEEGEDEDDSEPVYNEMGEEVIPLQIFDEPNELSEVDGWLDLEGARRRDINDLILTQSQVFSIYITAIKQTGADQGWVDAEETVDEFENSMGNQLVRTIRAVYWRRNIEDEVQMVPVVRWEVLDYVPFEVLDYPDEDR